MEVVAAERKGCFRRPGDVPERGEWRLRTKKKAPMMVALSRKTIIFAGCMAHGGGHEPCIFQRYATFRVMRFWPMDKERCSSGLRGTSGKRVGANTASGVRIPLFPPCIWQQIKHLEEAKCKGNRGAVLVKRGANGGKRDGNTAPNKQHTSTLYHLFRKYNPFILAAKAAFAAKSYT